jgi:hypothetical protein
MMFSTETLLCIICLAVCCRDDEKKFKEVNEKLDRIEKRLKME